MLLKKIAVAVLAIFAFSTLKMKADCRVSYTYSITSGSGQGPYTILFTNLSTGSTANTHYQWEFSNNPTGAHKSVYVTTSQAPIQYTYTVSPYKQPYGFWYYVNITMYDSNAVNHCWSTIHDSIPVNASSCNAGFTYSVSGDTVQFTDVSKGTPASFFHWDFGDGTTSSAENPKHIYTNGQSVYNVCFTITNSDSTCWNQECQYVYLGFPCSPAFTYSVLSGSPNGIAPYTVLFNNNSSGGSSNTFYVWTLNGVNDTIYSKNSLTYTFTVNPTLYPNGIGYGYPMSLSMIDNSITNCSSSVENDIENVLYGIVVAPSSSNCQVGYTYAIDSVVSNKVHFTNTSTGGSSVNYLWDFSDGTTSTDQNPVHTFTAGSVWGANFYKVNLTINSPDYSCYSETFQFISVTPRRDSCYAEFTWSQDAYSINSVYFTNTSAASIVNYSWDFGDGLGTSNSQNPYYTYANPGYYQVSLNGSNTDASCRGFYKSYVYVDGTHNYCKSWFVIFPDSVNYGVYYGYDLAYTSSSAIYTWNWGDGTTSTGMYPSHNYQTPGTYQICLSINDTAYNCTNTFCDSVELGKKEGNMRQVNILKPNTALGIKNNQAVDNSIVIAPNPFGGSTNISYSISENAQVTMIVRDIMGREVSVLENETKPSGKYITTWDASGLARGIYLLQLNVNGNVSTKKLVLSGGQY